MNTLKKYLFGMLALAFITSNVVIAKAMPEETDIPTQYISNTSSATKVHANGPNSFYIDKNNSLWAWGDNSYGQLGDGTRTNRNKPVKIIDNVKSVVTDYEEEWIYYADESEETKRYIEERLSYIEGSHTMAIKTDGTLWAWGSNSYGQLGDGTKTTRTKPVKILDNVKSVSTTDSFTVALKNDGTVWSWGNNYSGQLGDGTRVDKYKPTKIMDNVESIVVSPDLFGGYTMAIKNDKSLWTWGYNGYGQLGDGTKSNKDKPTKVMDNVKAMSAGGMTSMAIKTDNTLWGWGHNYKGQVGDGANTDRTTPTKVLDNVKSVTTSYHNTKAIKNDGTLWSWGSNEAGSLGDGTQIQRNKPVKIMDNVKSVANGSFSGGVIKTDGTLWSWGPNYQGEVGDGTTVDIRLKPVQIMSNVKDVTSDSHSLALKADGTLWAWGENYDGQVGDGTTTNKNRPVKINIFEQSTVESIDTINIPTPSGVSLKGFPFLGDYDIEFKIPGLPVTKAMVSGNTYKMIVGLDPESIVEEDFEKDYENMSKFVDDVKKFEENGSKKVLLKDDFAEKFKNTKLPLLDRLGFLSNVSIDAQIGGVIAGEIEADGTHLITEASIAAFADISDIFSLQNNGIFPAGSVPIPYYYGASLGTELSFTLNLLELVEDLKYRGEVGITPELKPNVGVGGYDILELGVYGKLILDFNFKFAEEAEKNKIYNKIIGKGKVGIEYNLLNILKGTLIELPSDGKYELTFSNTYPESGYSANNIEEVKLNDPYDISSYKLLDRDYLNKPSRWLGSSKLTFSNKPTNTVATNIFPNSQPMIAEVAGKKVMVWHADNASRGSADRTELLFSVFNDSNSTWSAPKSVHNDGTADFYFDLGSDGKDMFVIWQNANKAFNNTNPSPSQICAVNDIMVSQFDTNTSTFKTPVRLTNNSTLDHSPKISVANGKVFTTWINNDANDLFGLSGKNSIMYSVFNGTSWESSKVAVNNQKQIISYSTAFDGTNGYVMYEVDTDNNVETVEDHEIYYVKISNGSAGAPVRLTNNKILDSNPQVYIKNGKVSAFYYSEENIKHVPDIANPVTKSIFNQDTSGLTDKFSLINNNRRLGLIWKKDVDGVIEVYSSIYDESRGKMSEAIKLTYDEARIKSVGGIFDKSGNIVLVYNKANKVQNNTAGVEYYSDGQSDLCVTHVTPAYNLVLDNDSITWNDDEFAVGRPMTINLDVENIGQKTISSYDYDIDMFDRHPNEPGARLLGWTSIREEIMPGEKKNFSVNFNPKEAKNQDIFIQLTPMRVDDFDMSDNVGKISVGHEDLEVVAINELNSMNDNINIGVNVKNNSQVPSNGFTVTIRDGAPDGKVLDTKRYGTLGNNMDTNVEFSINPDKLNITNSSATIYAEVKSGGNELITVNNTKFMVINRYTKEDVNQDGKVDIVDMASIANNYNTTNVEDSWDMLCDINKDGIIDIFDLVLLSKKII